MPALYSPEWFSGFDILFELFFALISLTIASFAYWIYTKSDQRSVKSLSFAFLLISLSYVARSVPSATISLYAHIVLFLSGLAILVSMTLKQKKALYALLAITLAFLLLFSNTLLAYYLISSVFLVVISWHYIQNYLVHRQTTALLVALAFIFLFFGSFHVFMSVNHEIFYFIGYALDLLAYILITVNLYLVLKK